MSSPILTHDVLILLQGLDGNDGAKGIKGWAGDPGRFGKQVCLSRAIIQLACRHVHT